MRTVLVFKWSRDPQDASVSVDGQFNWGNAKLSASDDDPAAMQVAQAVSADDEVVALTIGNGDAVWAAARGAASTVIVDDFDSDNDAFRTASIIKGAIEHSGGADVVVIGDSEWDKGVVVSLVAELGMPAFAGVVDLERIDDAYRIFCKNGSVTKVIEAQPPFLLAVRGLSSEKAVPGMKQVLQARKKPKQVVGVADLPAMRDCAAEPRKTMLPESDAAVLIDGSDADAAAGELLGALKRQGVL